jgi:hypothetical protein
MSVVSKIVKVVSAGEYHSPAKSDNDDIYRCVCGHTIFDHDAPWGSCGTEVSVVDNRECGCPEFSVEP